MFVAVQVAILLTTLQTAGNAFPSFTSKMLQDPGLNSEQEHAIKFAANSIYGGGTDPVGTLEKNPSHYN